MVIIKKLLITFGFQLLIYFGLFIIIPASPFKDYDVVWIVCGVLVAIGISTFAVLRYIHEIKYWGIGILMMWGMICIYHPQDIYGISDSRFGFDLFPSYIDALGFSVGVFVVQSVLCVGKKVVKKQKK